MGVKMRALLKLLMFFQVLVAFSCGKQDLRKQFDVVIVIRPGEEDLRAVARMLIKDYNKNIGFIAIREVASSSERTSKMYFYSAGEQPQTEDLKNAIGLGSHEVVEIQNNPNLTMRGLFGSKSSQFTFDVSFLDSYFRDRLVNLYDKDSKDYVELYHVFCHEVGHGMGFPHSKDDPLDVMYPINRDLVLPDYRRYYKRATYCLTSSEERCSPNPNDGHGSLE